MWPRFVGVLRCIVGATYLQPRVFGSDSFSTEGAGFKETHGVANRTPNLGLKAGRVFKHCRRKTNFLHHLNRFAHFFTLGLLKYPGRKP